MIGLVVIDILITLGMLFLTKFSFSKDPEQKVFERKRLAESTMAAIMKTTAFECSQSGFYPQIQEDILEDCAQSRQSSAKFICGGLESCAYLDEIIPRLLEESLGGWHVNYEFESVLVSYEEPLVLVNEGLCSNRDRDTSGEFLIYTDAGLVRSVLYVCG